MTWLPSSASSWIASRYSSTGGWTPCMPPLYELCVEPGHPGAWSCSPSGAWPGGGSAVAEQRGQAAALAAAEGHVHVQPLERLRHQLVALRDGMAAEEAP